MARIADALIIGFCLFMTAGLYDQAWTPAYVVAAILAVGGFLLVAELTGLYRQPYAARRGTEFGQILVTWAILVAGLISFAFATKTSTQYSRLVVTGWGFGTPLLLETWRLAHYRMLRSLRLRGIQTQTVAIAGCTPVAQRLVSAILNDPTQGLVVRGIYDDRGAHRRFQGAEKLVPFVGSLDQLVETARQGHVDAVYITLPMRAEARAAELIRRLADTTATVCFVPDFFVFDLLHAHWSSLGDVPILSVFDTPFHGIEGWLKRAEDIILGSIALIFAAPLMFGITIAVRKSSKGPVFFRQRRYGLSGREIHVFKFRTMTVCEDGATVQQARQNDARVTKLGVFLRRTSLDELPQLFNVVAGSMSLVGPRPHAVAHNEIYRNKIQGYMLRHKVKPGITGWAQVNGWRGETDTIEKMEKRVEHDLYYIQHWSIWLDLWILILTIFGRKTRQNAH